MPRKVDMHLELISRCFLEEDTCTASLSWIAHRVVRPRIFFCLANSPILGLLEIAGGRIAVYGDSNCLDSSHMVTNCYLLLKKILDFTAKNIKDPVLFSDSTRQDKPLYLNDNQLPFQRTDVNLSTYSRLVGKELICGSESRFEVRGMKGYALHVRGRNRRLPGYGGIDLGGGLNFTREIPIFSHSKSTEKDDDDPSGNRYLHYFYRNDLDLPEFVAIHWLIPVVAAVAAGFLLLYSFWKIRQKGRRRRKGSGSSHFTNP